jgi:hypothetical protein
MGSLPTLVRTYTPKAEAFWQKLVLAEEDRAALTSAKWKGGYRWFRSPNIVPIEHYRRPEALLQRKVS